MLNHFDPDKVEIARKATNLIGKYGDVVRMPYLKESGAIDNLVQELEALDAPAQGEEAEDPAAQADGASAGQLSAIRLDGWLSELKKANAQFKQLFAERNAANLERDTISKNICASGIHWYKNVFIDFPCSQ